MRNTAFSESMKSFSSEKMRHEISSLKPVSIKLNKSRASHSPVNAIMSSLGLSLFRLDSLARPYKSRSA
jgi:hypothetical protein